MDTIFTALITSYNDGCVESIPHLFSTFEKAMEFLHTEYLDIKARISKEDSTYDIDETNNYNDNQTEWFNLEVYKYNYWCRGEIYGLGVN